MTCLMNVKNNLINAFSILQWKQNTITASTREKFIILLLKTMSYKTVCRNMVYPIENIKNIFCIENLIFMRQTIHCTKLCFTVGYADNSLQYLVRIKYIIDYKLHLSIHQTILFVYCTVIHFYRLLKQVRLNLKQIHSRILSSLCCILHYKTEEILILKYIDSISINKQSVNI